MFETNQFKRNFILVKNNFINTTVGTDIKSSRFENVIKYLFFIKLLIKLLFMRMFISE